MKLTVGQLKVLIAESLDLLPSRAEVESQLQSSKFDKDAGAKVMSRLDRVLPTGSKLLLQSLSRALQAWQAGKGGWNQVSVALDKLYAAQGSQRHTSCTSLRAARAPDRSVVA